MSELENIPDFCFFFPYYDDSGVPVLFHRLANTIAASYPNAQISVIDYENGAMARHLQHLPNLKLLIFQDGQKIIPPANAILITQSLVPYHWPEELVPDKNTLLFFWNLHPQNFVPALIPFKNLRDTTINNFSVHLFLSFFFRGTIKQIKNYVSLLLSKKALSFMDQTNLDTTGKYLFYNKINAQYLPVPVSTAGNLRKQSSTANISNYCWIGRLCDFKVNILIYTANKLASVAQNLNYNITYHIVGDGPLSDYVKNNIAENQFFKVRYHGAISHSEIDEFLLEKIDVVTAMGTSVLEGAKLGIPSILLHPSYRPIKGDYQFRLLYQTANYDLGHFISKSDYKKHNNSLKEIVLSIKNNYNIEADKCYKYFIENHSIDMVAGKFILQASNSTLRFGMIDKRLFEKPPILKLLNKIRSKA